MKSNSSLYDDFRFSFALLSGSAKQKYLMLLIVSSLAALLDLLAITVFSLAITSLFSKENDDTSFLNTIDIIQQIDRLAPSLSGLQATILVFVLVAAILLVKTIAMIFLSHATLTFLAKQHSNISKEITKNFLQGDTELIQEYKSSDLGFRLNHAVYYSINSTLGAFIAIFNEITLLIVVLSVLSIIFPSTTFILFLYFLIFLGLSNYIARPRAKMHGSNAVKGYIDSLSRIKELLDLYRELRLNSTILNFQHKFNESVALSAVSYSKQTFYTQVPKYIFEIALVLGLLLVSLFEVVFANGQNNLALLSVFIISGIRLAPSLIRLQGALLTIKVMSPSIDKLRELLANDIRSQNSVCLQSKQVFVPQISLSNLTFHFSKDEKPVLSGVNLIINPYDIVGIFGPVGSGKSTLIDLILGFKQPSSGTSRISGNLSTDAVQIWPGKISLIKQEIKLIEGSISENIALGLDASEIDYEKVAHLLDRLGLGELMDKKLGSGTQLGENGLGLSGGQRQKIALARALYSNPEILLLDEATSSQDPESEKMIIDLLKTLKGRCTIVIVAHQSRLFSIANRVVKISNGQLNELEIAKLHSQINQAPN